MSAGYTRTTILVVAAALGLITATLGYIYVSRHRQAAGRFVQAVVAAEYIPARTVVSPDMVEMANVPASDVQPDTALSLSEVSQRVTMTPIEKGQPVALSNLADKSAVFGLAAVIPPGTRAMTISVDATDIVPGFLQPGLRVDVVAGFVDGSDSVAKTILQNVPLLAVNENLRPLSAQPGEQPEQPAKPPTSSQVTTQPTATLVTIAVTPSEAERLVAAQYKGKLKLGLRGMSDNSRVETLGANTSLMMGAARATAQVTTTLTPPPSWGAKTAGGTHRKRAAPPGYAQGPLPPMTFPLAGAGPTPGARSIRVIRGTEVQDVSVDQ